MSWTVKKGYSDRSGISNKEYWEIVCSWLGLREEQYNSFIAKSFGKYLNGKEIRVGYSRQLVGTQGTIHYLTLDEYNPEEFSFTVSISSESLDTDTRYLIIRNQITETEDGARWNIEVSEKRSVWNILTGGLSSNLNNLFHGNADFKTKT